MQGSFRPGWLMMANWPVAGGHSVVPFGTFFLLFAKPTVETVGYYRPPCRA
jgi:hypothetical protein